MKNIRAYRNIALVTVLGILGISYQFAADTMRYILPIVYLYIGLMCVLQLVLWFWQWRVRYRILQTIENGRKYRVFTWHVDTLIESLHSGDEKFCRKTIKKLISTGILRSYDAKGDFVELASIPPRIRLHFLQPVTDSPSVPFYEDQYS